jgi:aquaporin Z
MQKYLVEFIGTFFWMLTAILTVNNPSVSTLAPLAIGGMVAAMVYAGGRISGAHFNPAISLAMVLRGKIEGREAGVYIFAQVLGAAVAAAIGSFLHSCGGEGAIVLHGNHDPVCALLAEFLGAFALSFVMLNAASTEGETGRSAYALAAGFALMAAIYGLGAVSGGAFNPAIAIGGSLAGMYAGGDLWIYVAGALAGGAAGATVATLSVPEE